LIEVASNQRGARGAGDRILCTVATLAAVGARQAHSRRANPSKSLARAGPRERGQARTGREPELGRGSRASGRARAAWLGAGHRRRGGALASRRSA